MKKSLGLKVLIVTALVSFLSCIENSKKEESKSIANSKPNIVLIIADDLGWMDLACYGNPYFETPNLDMLASSGLKFTNAYSAAHVCSPTRASILTGKYPARIGLTNYLYGTKTLDDSPVNPAFFEDRLPLGERTIAEELKGYGYETALIGKWHLGENTSFGESDPKYHGFDVTEGFDYELRQQGDTYKWFKIGGNQAFELPYLTDEITSNSTNYISKHKDSSFFLTVAHFAVHMPLQAKDSLVEKYRNKSNPRPEDFSPVYAAMVEQLDTSVGAIMESLKSNGILDNTLVIFISDNGGLSVAEGGVKPTDNAPLRSGKGTMYEGGIRVPMIASWPGKIKEGSQTNGVVSTIDLFPTLAEIAGIKNEAIEQYAIDGTSISNLLYAKDFERKNALYWHYPHFSNQGGRPVSAILKDDFKLIYSLENDSLQLFNLKDDLAESTNLASKNPELAMALRDSIKIWQHKVNAHLPSLKK